MAGHDEGLLPTLDPADADGLGDGTVAAKSGGQSWALDDAVLAPSKGRLRMRAGVPELPKYKGKKIKRAAVFAEADDGDDDSVAPDPNFDMPMPDDEEGSEQGDTAMDGTPAAFRISGDMEEEYRRMLESSKEELEIMRQPSAAEVASRTKEATELKGKLAAWKALVEFRIHLESALGLSHRLPVGDDHAALISDTSAASAEADKAAKEVREVLTSLISLQARVAHSRKLVVLKEGSLESCDSWTAVDSVLQELLSWGLSAADEWKEQTRLDSRRSFKVLDQSLATQMQAVMENPSRMRQRCCPPTGRHSVISLPQAAGSAAQAGGSVDTNPETSSSVAAGETTAGAERHIVDDREFYVQLLREVLCDAGGQSSHGGASDDIAEAQAQLQGRRAQKRKAKADVERRASKGRKIRYVPIEKLQNFMAPRARRGDLPKTMEVEPIGEDAGDALVRSLFRRHGA